MNLEMALDILRHLVSTTLMLITPLMVTAIGVGLIISLLQSVTSIQEQTLTFVPKLVTMAGVLLITGSWMLRTLVDFTIFFIEKMADVPK